MEHEEIDLEHKGNLRNKGTRYGMKSRSTVKYNRVEDRTFKNYQGEIKDLTNGSVTLSLKKKKNWEIVTRSLEESDSGVRVVQLDYKDRLLTVTEEKRLKGELTDPEPEPPTIVNGENRKGFFVREKRKQGKRGVQARKAVSDGEESSDSSSADEDGVDPAYKPKERVICVWSKSHRQSAESWRKMYRGCNCDYCKGIEKNQTTKNRNLVREEAVTLL